MKPDVEGAETGSTQALSVIVKGFRNQHVFQSGALLRDFHLAVAHLLLEVVIKLREQFIQVRIWKLNFLRNDENATGAETLMNLFYESVS